MKDQLSSAPRRVQRKARSVPVVDFRDTPVHVGAGHGKTLRQQMPEQIAWLELRWIPTMECAVREGNRITARDCSLVDAIRLLQKVRQAANPEES